LAVQQNRRCEALMAEPARTRPPAASAADRDALVATKLHAPRPHPRLRAPSRLLARLAAGMAGELTLVCAPAGFGKTSLLADWARRRPLPVAWLSLDPATTTRSGSGALSPPPSTAPRPASASG
jgi:LuxR family transcriptional regulator, maltose regulon positive regulatory protein